jgi:hypothetical protein
MIWARYAIAACCVLAIVLGSTVLAKNNSAARYAAGQVWTYKTRNQDQGSLLKIHAIEQLKMGESTQTVYHIGLINARIGKNDTPVSIEHLPVLKKTLDSSVVKQVRSSAKFEAPDEGISLWREAKGGAFDISVRDIVDVVAAAMKKQNDPAHSTDNKVTPS